MKAKRPFQARQLLKRWGRRIVERWLRMRGWRVEGRAPSPATPSILVVGPAAGKGEAHAPMLKMALRWLRTPYFYAGPDLAASKMRKVGRDDLMRATTAIVQHDDLGLIDWHAAARGSKSRIQVLTIEARHKRIRYHSPFYPSKYASRDRAYVKRMYSYFS